MMMMDDLKCLTLESGVVNGAIEHTTNESFKEGKPPSFLNF